MKTFVLVFLLLAPDANNPSGAAQSYETQAACEKDRAAIQRAMTKMPDKYVAVCAPIEGGVRL